MVRPCASKLGSRTRSSNIGQFDAPTSLRAKSRGGITPSRGSLGAPQDRRPPIPSRVLRGWRSSKPRTKTSSERLVTSIAVAELEGGRFGLISDVAIDQAERTLAVRHLGKRELHHVVVGVGDEQRAASSPRLWMPVGCARPSRSIRNTLLWYLPIVPGPFLAP